MNRLIVFSSFFFFTLLFTAAAQTNAQARKSVSGAEVTGTFRDVSGSEFSILALGKGKIRVSFSGVYNYKTLNGEATANLGEASGEAEIAGDTAIFKPSDTERCAITMRFLPNRQMKVTQKGTDAECGFGANVSAGGNYKKVSSAKPKFSAQGKQSLTVGNALETKFFRSTSRAAFVESFENFTDVFVDFHSV